MHVYIYIHGYLYTYGYIHIYTAGVWIGSYHLRLLRCVGSPSHNSMGKFHIGSWLRPHPRLLVLATGGNRQSWSFLSWFQHVPKTPSRQCGKIFIIRIIIYHNHHHHYHPSWLVVWTPLKNMSQLGWLFPIYGKIKNVPSHQPARFRNNWQKATSWNHQWKLPKIEAHQHLPGPPLGRIFNLQSSA